MADEVKKDSKYKEEDYKRFLSELSQMSVPLDSDPVSLGLSALNEKISGIQAKKDSISNYLLRAIGNKTAYEVEYKTAKDDHEIHLDNLMSTDSNVRSEKSDLSRRAAANVMLKEKVMDVHVKLLELTRAENYLKCVYHIYNNLCSAQENLSRQISVIQMSLNIGEIHREDLKNVLPRTVKVKTSESSEK